MALAEEKNSLPNIHLLKLRAVLRYDQTSILLPLLPFFNWFSPLSLFRMLLLSLFVTVGIALNIQLSN